MNKQGFINYLREKTSTNVEFELALNILNYSQDMDKENQFNFLWGMLDSLNIEEDILANLEI